MRELGGAWVGLMLIVGLCRKIDKDKCMKLLLAEEKCWRVNAMGSYIHSL